MRSPSLIAAALAGLPGRPPAPAPTRAARPVAVSRADSVVRDGLVYRGRAAVVPGRAGRELEVRVKVRNARPDTAEVIQGAPECDPPLRLLGVADRRTAVWDELAWRAAAARRVTPCAVFLCPAVAIVAPLAPGARRELRVQRYPVRAVRGDSLPAGWYEVAVGIGRGGDTLRVPAGRVRLP